MRLILFDLETANRRHFFPIALSRPIWELRCGITSLAEKLIAKAGAADAACFVPAYMADAYRAQTSWPVNDPRALTGDDLLLLNPRLKAAAIDQIDRQGPGHVAIAPDGETCYVWLRRPDIARLDTASLDTLLESARTKLSLRNVALPAWNYIWDLILASPQQIAEDFNAAGRWGIEGAVEQPNAIRGSARDVYIAPTARLHPMVVIDAEHGPVYLDEGVEVHPFTRIEGPCYVAKNSILLGAKCREGSSIGPFCRIGGEVEESIIHGYSNKYHDGFLGHAYVGQWVNLGALTTNSDLKNDYGPVDVILDGRTPISTGSVKVGALIGDHTKTSIGALFNSGAYVGAMSLIMATGKPLPKYIPEFSWLLEGVVTKGFGKAKLYETARIAMSRRKVQWTDADQAMWDAVFDMTAPQRDEAIRRGRRHLLHG
jgi:UDP-N-acetylglucosamine diphosphorylase/glucosamine-1-phosphate N-acetyltransferase